MHIMHMHPRHYLELTQNNIFGRKVLYIHKEVSLFRLSLSGAALSSSQIESFPAKTGAGDRALLASFISKYLLTDKHGEIWRASRPLCMHILAPPHLFYERVCIVLYSLQYSLLLTILSLTLSSHHVGTGQTTEG